METTAPRNLRRLGVAAMAALALACASSPSRAQRATITIASATAPQHTGLFKEILPAFKKATGIETRVIAVGAGQALEMGRRGEADVVFTNDREAEDKFVAAGDGVKRLEVMHNDFILVGPRFDPAKAAGSDMVEGFRKIVLARALFASRSDRSGAHAAELQTWKAAGIDLPKVKDVWYRELGTGMGPALEYAASMNAYVLADRGTWLSFRNRANLVVITEGEPRLVNQYAAILVNPRKHSSVQAKAGQRFVDWITSRAGQAAIAAYRIEGEQPFTPSQKPSR